MATAPDHPTIDAPRALPGGVAESAMCRLLDRRIDEETLRLNTIHAARPVERRRSATTAAAVMRLGGELLALPAAALRHVDPPSAIQPIPHRRSAALRGLAAVRGELLPCVDLAAVLGLPAQRSTAAADDRRERRTIVLASGGRPGAESAAGEGWAMEVDAVLGVERFEVALIRAAPATVRHALDACTAGLLDAASMDPQRRRTIALLDVDQLLARFKAALA